MRTQGVPFLVPVLNEGIQVGEILGEGTRTVGTRTWHLAQPPHDIGRKISDRRRAPERHPSRGQ
jgi:hypothetical protein